MLVPRLPPEPGPVLEFFEEALTALGALCERSWHDRLEVVAEGEAARLWRPDGGLHESTLHFRGGGEAGATAAPAPDSEVFPGCPLTFRLCELLRPATVPLERFVLAAASAGPPEVAVTEKLWHARHKGTSRWRLTAPFVRTWHFSLVARLRCEVQAIDQHWSLHRLAFSLADGERDEALAAELSTAAAGSGSGIEWPVPDFPCWRTLLQPALEEDMAPILRPLRARQQKFLGRELGRLSEYFTNYEAELVARGGRSRTPDAKAKTADRLTATRAEHRRRRDDQVARHVIRVIPHLDALLLVAEPAWSTTLAFEQDHVARAVPAVFLPRSRRWVVATRDAG